MLEVLPAVASFAVALWIVPGGIRERWKDWQIERERERLYEEMNEKVLSSLSDWDGTEDALSQRRRRVADKAEGWFGVLAHGSDLEPEEFIDLNMNIFEEAMADGDYFDAFRLLVVETGHSVLGLIGELVLAVRRTETWAQAHKVAVLAKHWATPLPGAAAFLAIMAMAGFLEGSMSLLGATLMVAFVWGLLLAVPPIADEPSDDPRP